MRALPRLFVTVWPLRVMRQATGSRSFTTGTYHSDDPGVSSALTDSISKLGARNSAEPSGTA